MNPACNDIYLERAESKLEHQPLSLADFFWGKGEHGVVDPKQRDE